MSLGQNLHLDKNDTWTMFTWTIMALGQRSLGQSALGQKSTWTIFTLTKTTTPSTNKGGVKY